MKRTLLLSLGVIVLLGSCGSKKKHVALQASNETLKTKLDEANRALGDCNSQKSILDARLAELKTRAIKAQKAAGADSNSVVDLPDHIMFSRKNINGEGDFGRIDVSNFENLEAFPRTDLKYADISLSSAANLFDRDTQWKIPGLVGKRKYTLTIYTGFRGAN